LILSFGYVQPLVISPINGFEGSEGSILFSFEKANLILIDDNLDFSSPNKYHAEDDLIINLKPGIYYWKSVGAFPSKVRYFTIKSEVDLKIREAGEEYEVINGGNTKLNVEVYRDGVLSGNIILDVGENGRVKGDKFIGGEDE